MATAASSTMEIVCQGWLLKATPGMFCCMRTKWNLLWFILKTKIFPEQIILEYHDDWASKRTVKTINMKDCKEIRVPLFKEDDSDRFPFVLKTNSKTYNLAAYSKTKRTKWIRTLCQTCGFVIVDSNWDETVHAKPKIKLDSKGKPIKGSLASTRKRSISDPGIVHSELAAGAKLSRFQLGDRGKAAIAIGKIDPELRRRPRSSNDGQGRQATKSRQFSPRPCRRGDGSQKISTKVVVHGEPGGLQTIESCDKPEEAPQCKEEDEKAAPSEVTADDRGHQEIVEEIERQLMEIEIACALEEQQKLGATASPGNNGAEKGNESDTEIFV